MFGYVRTILFFLHLSILVYEEQIHDYYGYAEEYKKRIILRVHINSVDALKNECYPKHQPDKIC